MNNLTDWIDYSLYPAIFESIDIAFPEHNFKRCASGWRSKTYIDGSPHKSREDKTVVNKKAYYCILEQGGEAINLVKYIMRRDGVECITALKILADVVRLKLPANPDFSRDDYHKYKDRSAILECCNSYFIWCLENATGPGASGIQKYLKTRGYSPEDVKSMELGYIPSQAKLIKYLADPKRGFSRIQIDEVIKAKTDTRIGTTHGLVIPYRSGGSIKGFKFRTIGTTDPKYLNLSGLDKSGGFFNILGIKGDKDIVVVEGELDSLHATVRGVKNVVALAGSSISSDQVKDAQRRGAKSFTICLDTEPGKEQETAKCLNSIIAVILAEGLSRVYIMTLPAIGGIKTDPDRLLKETGVESFNTAIAQALPYYEYQLRTILLKYDRIEKVNELQPKDKDNLLEEVLNVAAKINEPIDLDQYKKLFTSQKIINELGISEESLSITVDRLTCTREKEAQASEFKKLISDAIHGQEKGEFAKNQELMEKLKAIAYWEGAIVEKVINFALQEAVSKYEKTAGEIKPIPKK